MTTDHDIDALLRRLTIAIRSAFAVGLPVIASTCEDAATTIILLQAERLPDDDDDTQDYAP